MKKFTLITPVWGEGHTKLFLEVGLPSLLARGNIPRLAEVSRVNYLIYTKKSDFTAIKNASIFKDLERIIDVSIHVFEDIYPNPHSAMSECHKQGFSYAVKNNGYAVFIPPDCIWSHSSLAAMYNIVNRGYKIIHMSGLRLVRESFCAELKPSPSTLCLSSRELVTIALRHLHPITLSHFFNEYTGGLMPANLFWGVEQNNILARCFHLHPLMVYGTKRKCDFKSTIDDDLGLVFDAAEHDEYVVTDSDELIAFEISSLSHQVLAAYRKGNIDDIVSWAKVCTNIKHRDLIKNPIYIHSDDIVDDIWERVEEESSAVVSTVLDQLNSEAIESVGDIGKFAHSKNITRILSSYANNVNKLADKLNSLMHSTSGLYQWHWNYPFQRDVCDPFMLLIKNSSGKIMYFDDPYYPVIHQINFLLKDKIDTQIDLRDWRVVKNYSGKLARIYNGYYDLIIIRDLSLSVDISGFFSILSNLLKPNGKIIIYTKMEIDLESLKINIPENIVFMAEEKMGGVATKALLTAYHAFCDNRKKIPFLKRTTYINTIKLSLVWFLVVIFPVCSICTSIINFMMPKNIFWAIKRLDFQKHQ